MIKVAINGLGRIGRLVLREWCSGNLPGINIVCINDLVEGENLAYLLKYDSVHGRVPYAVSFEDGVIRAGDASVAYVQQADPALLPWRDFDVDVVLECTGLFRRADEAVKHIEAGAKKVIISAPSESADMTLVMGVNDGDFDVDRHHIISNASCTTNSLAPPLKVLLDTFGIESVMVTTVHSYTTSQGIVDQPARKHIRGRAAAVNIIPTSTGADAATAIVIPELNGKISATALRVPVPDGAITDITVTLSKVATEKEINQALKSASESSLKGILEYTEDEIVSSDIIKNPHSGIVHGLSTKVICGNVAKLHVWYDNEYGYAMRLIDACRLVSKRK